MQNGWDALRASPTVMQLDFAFLKFAKNLKKCSLTVLHLTYAFWQTWHLMDQTWHFCIAPKVWHMMERRLKSVFGNLESIGWASIYPRLPKTEALGLLPSRTSQWCFGDQAPPDVAPYTPARPDRTEPAAVA